MIEFMNAIRWEVVGFTLVVCGAFVILAAGLMATRAGRRHTELKHKEEMARMEAKNSTTRLTHSGDTGD